MMMPTILGQPITRIDGRLKVTGAARYAAEFPVPNAVHAVLVLTTAGSGRVTSFDTSDAQGLPGVLRIITPENALKLHNTHPPTLQDMTVFFNGQPIAVVVAERLEQAIAAAEKVRVHYEVGEPVTRMSAAMDQAYAPKHFRNGARSPNSLRGDPEANFDAAPNRIDVTYQTPIENHNPMEPHATIARWDGDRLTVWHATQGVSSAQAALAGAFGIDKSKVQVIDPFVGGGFGCKGSTWPPALLSAMAAKIVGRPVKLVLTRPQMFTCNGYRPQTIQKLSFATDDQGRLTSMRHQGYSQMSMPDLGEYSEPVGLPTEMLYACDNVAVSHRVVPTNASLPTYMRAPGEAPGVYALEASVDELAAQLHMDPLEFRLRNYTDHDPHENKPFASKMLRECYKQGADTFGWSRRTPEPRSMRDGRMLVGWGMATSTYPTNQRPAQVRVRVAADGMVLVQSGTQDLGTGTYTVMSQVAADTLGVPVKSVRFELGDSTLPPAPVSGGSSTVPSVAPAVLAACQAVRGKIFDLARSDAQLGWHDVPTDTLRLQNGAVVAPGGSVPVAALLQRAGQDAVEAEAGAALEDSAKHYSRHAFGAQFAEVRVDPDLGTIRVNRWVAAFDAGQVLNAKTAHSQLIGGITFGIGMALLEETHVDAETGRIVNSNVAEYLMPVNADVPDIQAVFVANDERNSNPLGVKGVGELPMVGVAAAIANAVYHATGVRVRKVPIRIEDVLV